MIEGWSDMRDQSPKERKLAASDGALKQRSPACLARFSLNHKTFQLFLCHKKASASEAEILRFDLDGATLAIVEDSCPEESFVQASDLMAKLTGRELQIATLVAAGDANKSIARKLRISEWTVSTHLRRIYAKLNVDKRAAMVYRCAPLIDGAASAILANRSPDRRTASREMHEVVSRARQKLRDGNLVGV
jgi:DNA-binding CsgD family transcriptional regulator